MQNTSLLLCYCCSVRGVVRCCWYACTGGVSISSRATKAVRPAILEQSHPVVDIPVSSDVFMGNIRKLVSHTTDVIVTFEDEASGK